MKRDKKLTYIKEFLSYLNPHRIQGRILIFTLSFWIGLTIFVATILFMLLTHYKPLLIIIEALK